MIHSINFKDQKLESIKTIWEAWSVVWVESTILQNNTARVEG